MMTYNWDNMVEITVPKGTNGWVYSGEVTINGVNVKFPVGTPTTVPEPAAALLNKMIELEREDDLSGAKPNNHYVGNVTVPDGKTLTLQKGAKVVDEAGVLGGSSAPAHVVILPETTAEVDPDAGVVFIMTPMSATPTDGGTAKIVYNGAEYTSPILYISDNGLDGYAMGNTGAIGIPGGNSDAPFLVALYTAETDGAYGMFMPMDGATSVTVSITEGASSGAAESPVVVVPFVVDNSMNINITKSFDDILALANSGKVVFITGVFAYATWFLPLVAARDNSEGSTILFAAGDGKDSAMVIEYTRDGANLTS
jgi:hypothetical protein